MTRKAREFWKAVFSLEDGHWIMLLRGMAIYVLVSSIALLVWWATGTLL
jgi:hypothetical protein